MLSPSQVRSFMDCQARWWFKHGLRYPDPSTGKMALGRAVHAALGENFAQKIESCEDLPFAGVIALFRDAWAFEREQTEFRDDEDPAELAACGERLVAKYLDEVAPLIMPAAVELWSRARSPGSGFKAGSTCWTSTAGSSTSRRPPEGRAALTRSAGFR